MTSLLVGHAATQQQAVLCGLRQPLLAPTFLPLPPAIPEERMIERTALLDRLDQSLNVKLTLVTAPAGFGKTMLLSQWYEHFRQQQGNECAIPWITLDERDNDPARFWNSVWSTLRGGGKVQILILLSRSPRHPDVPGNGSGCSGAYAPEKVRQ